MELRSNQKDCYGFVWVQTKNWLLLAENVSIVAANRAMKWARMAENDLRWKDLNFVENHYNSFIGDSC